MQHDEQEDQRDRDVRQQRDGLDPLVGVQPQRRQQLAHRVREERALTVGEVAGVDGGTADEGIAEDDQEDHEQDQPGAAGVRPVEA